MDSSSKPSEATYDDFSKINLRVAKILAAERVEGSEKLVKLLLSLGTLGERTIVAGIGKHYTPEILVGKKIVVIANLQPRMLKGIESNGMLLAASSEDHSQLTLLTIDSDIAEGSSVG